MENDDNNERKIQKRIDEPVLIQGNFVNGGLGGFEDSLKMKESRLKWEKKSGYKDVKFTVKAWNDSSVLLRVNNMNDEKNVSVELFSSDRICTFLTSYYGNLIRFNEIVETNMGGNIEYK